MVADASRPWPIGMITVSQRDGCAAGDGAPAAVAGGLLGARLGQLHLPRRTGRGHGAGRRRGRLSAGQGRLGIREGRLRGR